MRLFNKNRVFEDPEKLPPMLNIEFLRIVFTFAIVWNHIAWRFGFYAQWAYTAVEFFFILSGFLLLLTFRPEKTVAGFIKNKWIRFAPLVYFGVALNMLFAEKINADKLFADLFFYTRSGLYGENGYNPPSWYVAVLLFVSLFYFCLIKYLKKEIAYLIIATVCFLSAACFVKYGLNDAGLFTSCQIRAFACVGAGVFSAEIYRMAKNKNIVHQKMYDLMEAAILIFAISGVFIKGRYVSWVVSCLSFMALVVTFSLKKGCVSRFFEKPVFAKAARYCLSVYLTHWFFCIVIGKYMVDKKHEAFILAHDDAALFCSLCAVVLFAVFAHHVIEKPAVNALKKWIG